MTDFNKTWWQEYRRKQYVPRKKLNTEIIIRKSTRENAKEYLRNTSLGGLSHIASSNFGIKEGMFWVIVLCAVTATLFHCLMFIWSNMSNPLIVTMETTTYEIENIDFPAIAICNVNRVSKRAADKLAYNLYNDYLNATQGNKIGNKNIDFFKYFVYQAGRLIDFEYDLDYERYTSFLETLADYDDHKVIEIMADLSPNCSEMLLRCTWASKVYPCNDLFTVRRTARGHCCTFNYVYNYEGSNSRFKYSLDDVKKQKKNGARYGLNVAMDPFPDDYAYPLYPFKGFEVILFDPKHFPDISTGRIVQRFIENGLGLRLELNSRTQKATDEVRKYKPETTNCFFEDQLPKEIPRYSMSSCLLLCRLRTVKALCKCTPYIYPVRDGPICTLDDLKCLNKYKEKLLYFYPYGVTDFEGLELEKKSSLDCVECLPDCEHTQHFTKASKLHIGDIPHSLYEKVFRGKLFYGINMTNKCFLSVYQSTGDATLDRLDVVFYWFELLSNVGGYGGLLLGFSLIGAVEFMYYLSFRFMFVLSENYRQYH